MESDSDASGEELGIIRPGLIRELRNVLDEYPDDGQILKEMIQNAEDAGAKQVRILADIREFNQHPETKVLKKHPYLHFLKGPALCVYNDAEFSPRDWEGIRMVHTSVKEKDPLKVGRFGLGFKSVFHLTDRLLIISGNTLLYMDPFKGADNCCILKKLSKLKSREKETLLQTLEGIFGLDRKTLVDGTYNGTLFWFPLRQQPSELSHTVYNETKLNDLWHAFKTDSPTILLFLKNIESIELFANRGAGTGPVVQYSVCLAPSCLDSVRSKRAAFVSSIVAASNQLPEVAVSSCLLVDIEMADVENASQPRRESWLVVNYHSGRSVSQELLALCSDEDLSYKPYVGVAAPLGRQQDFQSHLFCFLPLPLDTQSPTGLPVHVNGFFALSQNRRHVKWPTADQQHNQAHMEAPLLWNCLLVRELLPRVYIQLLNSLRDVQAEDPITFYGAWPDLMTVKDKWQPLVIPVFQEMSTAPVFYTETDGGQWIALDQATLCVLHEDVKLEISQTIEHVYSLCHEKLVKIPQHVVQGLRTAGTLATVKTVTPNELSRLLKTCQSKLKAEEKTWILTYLCEQNDVALLEGLNLLPLDNGDFATFDPYGDAVYFCEKSELQLFPSLESRFCSCHLSKDLRGHLLKISQTGRFSFRQFEKSDVPSLVKASLQARYGTSKPRVQKEDQWLEVLWNYLTSHFADNLHAFLDLPLLPLTESELSSLSLLPLKGTYVCRSVTGVEQMSVALKECITKLGITVFQQLPPYVLQHRVIMGNLVQFPSCQGILTAIQTVTQVSSYLSVADTFNATASSGDRESLIEFVDNCSENTFFNSVKGLLVQLQLFSCTNENQIVSSAQVGLLAPTCLPPVPPPYTLLLVKGNRERRVALKLGAKEKELKDLCLEILSQMQPNMSNYTLLQTEQFMEFVLDQPLLHTDRSLLDLARNVAFVPTSSGEIKAVNKLYDPDRKLLQDLFVGFSVFPISDFSLFSKLHLLGLKDESNVSSQDLLFVVSTIDSASDEPTSFKRAKALWDLLKMYSDKYDRSTHSQIFNSKCLPCLHHRLLPQNYPQSLPLLHQKETLVKPTEVFRHDDVFLVGSVRPVATKDLNAETLKQNFFQQPTWKVVLEQLGSVIQHYDPNENLQYRFVLDKIYQYLSMHKSCKELCLELCQMPCVLVEAGASFQTPSKFWINGQADDIDLSLYRYQMTRDSAAWRHLFLACGSRECQDTEMLQQVLGEIQAKYLGHAYPSESNRDLRLVLNILEVLKDRHDINRDTVLLPVLHREAHVIHFRRAIECTVSNEDWLVEDSEQDVDSSEGVVYVHHDVPLKTALALGALGTIERALDGTEVIDFEYSQQEPLTTRLHNLLVDSYTDGFSVPKELLQNADDAGASVVQFLLDERLNEDCREHLLSKDMASFQGPALCVFNDAVFSDHDFDSIIKLGVGSKKGDAAKVGKFGLGFNTVYNLTDMPSFISKHSMAIFDPHRLHLKGKPGMKIDFRIRENRALLRKMPSQFKPFQGIFGCNLRPGEFQEFDGTLFRFPFRTDEQAAKSQIKSESYPSEKRKELFRLLIERAGNLLIFTQNVKRIDVFYLSNSCSSPKEMTPLMSATRESSISLISPSLELSRAKGSILRFCTDLFQKDCQSAAAPQPVHIKEEVVITLQVFLEASHMWDIEAIISRLHWLICWVSGTEQAAALARNHIKDGIIPLAAVAVPLQEDCHNVLCMHKCPRGFYKQGRLFCFLPLPDNVDQLDLGVHVNGTFALSSSRRGLLTQTDDDLGSLEADWNRVLFVDTVCRAHLWLLQNLQKVIKHSSDLGNYFALWPLINDDKGFAASFYKQVVNDAWMIFPHDEEWVSFKDAKLLEPVFQSSELGDIAFKSLGHFGIKEGILADVPAHICKAFEEMGQAVAIQHSFIKEFNFFQDYFFPNIANDYWKCPERIADRDSLIKHALAKEDLKPVIQSQPCIPSDPNGKLKLPSELIHPQRIAANLYVPEDEYFPQRSNGATCAINFCDSATLGRLVQLGMHMDKLDEDMLIERALTIQTLIHVDRNLALRRAHAILDYLAALVQNKIDFHRVKERLSCLKFLPVSQKPSDWPFKWLSEETGQLLASPMESSLSSMTNLVACTRYLFDVKLPGAQDASSNKRTRVQILEELHTSTEHSFLDPMTVSSVVEQLLMIAKMYPTEGSPRATEKKTEEICRNIYSFLNASVQNDKGGIIQGIISKHLAEQHVMWTGHSFTSPSYFAFKAFQECAPYLLCVTRLDQQNYHDIFQLLGVKDNFDADDILQAMMHMKDDCGDKTLTEQEVDQFCIAAQLLAKAVEDLHVQSLDLGQLSLPDRHGVLKPISCLCLDDCEWMTEKPSMMFIHSKFSPAVALALGVKTKCNAKFLSHIRAMPFGQKEKLPNRIKRLLDGYTFDASLFKELIQNADDAGATEIRFIKDFRTLGTTKIPVGWETLQGPALCVYNNAFFSSDDIAGIQTLGEGSKSEDMIKTGQFGVGFNAVYHVTDVPSFWTLVDGKEEVICVCDPCKFIQNDGWPDPGMMITDMEAFKQDYTDMMSGYLGTTFDMTKSATMFRLPLRTKQMAQKSDIKAKHISENDITKILNEFKKEARKCLLFLNNIRHIAIYTVKNDGELQQEFYAEAHFNKEDDLNEKKSFYSRLGKEAEKMKDDDLEIELQDVSPFQTILQFTVKDTCGIEEKWITVNRAGFADKSQISSALQTAWRKKHFRLLPRGGVAIRLQQKQDPESVSCGQQANCNGGTTFSQDVCKDDTGCAFCILPLPVKTGLPVHVNGHFALLHESRRALFQQEQDARTEWNEQICTNVIVQAYIAALQEVKGIWFRKTQKEATMQDELKEKLTAYYSLFPQLQRSEQAFWSLLVVAFYKQIVSGQHALFPVTRVDSSKIIWTSAWKKRQFAGYFIRPLSESHDRIQHIKSRDKKLSVTDSEPVENDASWPVLRSSLAETLKKVNMKLIAAPFHVFQAIKEIGADNVQVADAACVIDFLKSCGEDSDDSCNLKELPQPLQDTDVTLKEIVELIHYLQKDTHFSSKMEGLPLCLLQSGNLQCFNDGHKPFITSFTSLMPMLSNEFLHKSLVPIFRSLVKDAPNLIRCFSISDFASKLPLVLNEDILKTKNPCQLTEGLFPSDNWIVNAWKFLEEQLKHLSTEDEIAAALSCLADWSLLPVKFADSGARVLYPVKDRHCVLHLSVTDMCASLFPWKTPGIHDVLKKLPVPLLDLQMLSNTFIEKLVTSLSKPKIIMKILFSQRDAMRNTQLDAVIIMNYCCENILHLPQNVRFLMQIPMFITSNNEVVSLSNYDGHVFVPNDIPKDGLDEWSANTKTVLLDPLYFPDKLCQVLNITKPSNGQFQFWIMLLSKIDALPRDSILPHLRHIKSQIGEGLQDDRDALLQTLSQTAFIQGTDGDLHKPTEFYSPYNDVFRIMLGSTHFPPKPFCQVDWFEFLKSVKMVCDVTPDLFVIFARTVARECKQTGLSTDMRTKSKKLLEHLFKRHDLVASGLLNEIKDIPFVCPWEMENDREGRILAHICQPSASHHMISFSESCLHSDWLLVWSTTAIMDPEVEQFLRHCETYNLSLVRQCKDAYKFLQQQLRFNATVPNQKAKQHIINILQAFEDRAKNAGDSASVTGHNTFDRLFINIYKYLKTLSAEERKFLSNRSFVYDTKSGRVFPADQTVITLRSFEEISGWLLPLSHKFGQFVDLFQSLGVSKEVRPFHYANVLEKLYLSSVPSHPVKCKMLEASKKAITGLFRCLQYPSTNEVIGVETLYLLDRHCCLVSSDQLILADDAELMKRLQNNGHLHFFIGFEQLPGIVGGKNVADFLPSDYQMKYLSKVTTETVSTSLRKVAKKGTFSNLCKRKILSSEFVNGLTRLVNDMHLRQKMLMPDDRVSALRESLNQIQICELKNLHTTLVVNGKEMVGSESPQCAFREGLIVFVDAKACSDREIEQNAYNLIAATMVNIVQEVRDRCPLLQQMLADTGKIEDLLDHAGIAHYSATRQSGCLVPTKEGSFIPINQLCYLNNTFHQFNPEEMVALEIYDPLVENEVLAKDEASAGTLTSSSLNSGSSLSNRNAAVVTANDSHQVFIYSRVIQVITNKAIDHLPLFTRVYVVDIGSGQREVHCANLYKLQTDLPADVHCVQDNESILKRMHHDLDTAWPLVTDIRQRLCIIKRICLEWHPDVKTASKKFCEKVYELVEKHAQLQCNSGGNSILGRAQPAPAEHSDCVSVSPFLRGIFQRGCNYAQQISRQTPKAAVNLLNPQPGEGRRWLFQAEANLRTACQLRDAGNSESSNWICFLCFQAVEKALKALLYHYNAENEALHQNKPIKTLAEATQSVALQQSTASLEALIGNCPQMTEPLLLSAPLLPAGLYTLDLVKRACHLTTQILETSAQLLV